jgi:hypothetical protein
MKKTVCLVLGLLFLASGLGGAAEYIIDHRAYDPDNPGGSLLYCVSFHYTPDDLGPSADNFIGWNTDGAGYDWRCNAYQIFDIPDYGPNEDIVKIEIADLDGIALNIGLPPGLDVEYLADDSWDGSGINGPKPNTIVGSGQIINIEEPDWLVPGATFRTDITDFLANPGEGEGQPLSLKYADWQWGNRGAMIGYDHTIWPTANHSAVLIITTEETALKADIQPEPDGDGDVDIYDYGQYCAWYNALDPRADIQPEPGGDGDVDIYDYGQYCAWFVDEYTGNTIPEPATLLLVAGGALGLVLRKRS